MGLFKTLFGNVADELKKSYEDAKKEVLNELGFKSSKSSKSSTTRRNNGGNVRKQTTEKNPKATRRNNVRSVNKQTTEKKPRATVMSTYEQDSGKKLWWVENLELLYNGEKYALRYKYQSKTEVTEFIYDDVEILSRFQARISQKKQDGSIGYGVVVSNGWKFFVTDCDYTKVTYLDGGRAVMAIDEDGDKYAIENYGQIYSIEKYREHVQERNS